MYEILVNKVYTKLRGAHRDNLKTGFWVTEK